MIYARPDGRKPNTEFPKQSISDGREIITPKLF